MPLDLVSIRIPRTSFPSGTRFAAYVDFRDREDGAQTPDTVHFSIVCLTSGKILREGEVTPAQAVVIPILAADNDIQTPHREYERRQLTVIANRGESQALGSVTWTVNNIERTA